MNDNLVPVDEHDTVFAELPWYANGTLPDSLADRVDQHLAHCTICQNELRLMRKTYESVTVSATPQDQVDQSFKRVMNRIDAYESDLNQTAGTTDQSEGSQSSPYSQWAEKLRNIFSGVGSFWVPAASLAAIAVVSIFSVQLLQAPDGDNYSVLTSGEPGALSLRVRFKETAQPALVIRMVQSIGIKASVQTVNDQVYLVTLPANAAVTDLNEAFSQLNANAAVESVEAILKPAKPEK